MPSSPISDAVQTGIVVSVVAVPPCTSFSAPPFSVTSIRPSGQERDRGGLASGPRATTCSL